MKIEVNVSKKYFFALIAIVLVLAVVGVGVAYTATPGAVPTPVGHALSTIQGYFSGDTNLQVSLAKFCQTDGTNCAIPTASQLTGVCLSDGTNCPSQNTPNAPLYVTSIARTSTTHNGVFASPSVSPNGHAATETWIKSQLGSDYHFCTKEDILSYFKYTGSNAPAGVYETDDYNSCDGWTVTLKEVCVLGCNWVMQTMSFWDGSSFTTRNCDTAQKYLGCTYNKPLSCRTVTKTWNNNGGFSVNCKYGGVDIGERLNSCSVSTTADLLEVDYTTTSCDITCNGDVCNSAGTVTASCCKMVPNY